MNPASRTAIDMHVHIEADGRGNGLASPGRYERSAATLGRLAASVAEGSLRLAVQRVFPLSAHRAAFELLETRHLRGKVVVAVA